MWGGGEMKGGGESEMGRRGGECESGEGGERGLQDRFTYNGTGGGDATEDRQGNEYGHKLEGSHRPVLEGKLKPG